MALVIPLESFHTGVFLYPLSIVYGRRGGGRSAIERIYLQFFLIAIVIVIILFYLKQILTTTRNSFNHFSNQEKIFVTVQFLGCH